jgi:flagellar basal-body rod protein FlgF
MPKGIYAAASAMVTENRSLEVTASNLANAQSAGFRRTIALRGGFDSVLAAQGRTGNIAGNGGAGIQQTGTAYIFSQGDIKATGSQFDFALMGDGFFTVRDDQGQAWLTRDGSFSLDPAGRMVNSQGMTLEGQAGAIVIPNAAQDINIDENGRLYVEVPSGPGRVESQFVDVLRIARVDDPNSLQARNGQYFLAPGDVEDMDINSVSMVQGHLEGSNVEPVSELVNLIAIQRRFEAAQRAMQQQGEAGRGFSDLLRGA